MKKLLLCFILLATLFSCHKFITPSIEEIEPTILKTLRDSLSVADYSALDFGKFRRDTLSISHQRLIRIGFKGKSLLEDAVVLLLSGSGSVIQGKILHIEGKISDSNKRQKASFNGLLSISSLNRVCQLKSDILNGFILSKHLVNRSANSMDAGSSCADCTLPEVIVSSSYPSENTISWGAWLSLLSMFDTESTSDYLPVYFTGGGGGGSSASVISIDTEDPENKASIEPKKYTDCFGLVPDGSTTVYSISIATDLPTDGHPEIFYNWTDRSPGHAFIELSKSTPYESVTQNFGFYPTSSFKLITLDNSVYLTSKIVDDGGHEYQALYTLSLTAAQFQAAVNAVNNPRDHYNVGFYNCTDFALDVFNAAGGNLSIPHHAIPGFEVTGGSNTPQGLYEQIQSMKNNGKTGTSTTNGKEYGSMSKGPCN
jgi:hypothetical protein